MMKDSERHVVPLAESDVEAVTPTEARITTFTSLRDRDYRRFWLSLLASFGALHMQLIARQWLAYDLAGNSALALGLVAAAWGGPVLLLSLWGGVVTDRVKKRSLLIVTQLANMVITLVVAVLIATGVIAYWHLVLAAFATGVTFAFNAPGRQSFVPELVPRRQLMNAIGLNAMGSNMTRVLGYTLGGILIAIIGVAGVYFLVVGLSAMSALLLSTMNTRGEPVEREKTSVRTDLRNGLHYIWHNPLLISLFSLEFIPVMIAMPYMNMLPVFAVDVFQRGPQGLGFLMGAAGAGSLLGALTVASLGDFKRKGRLLLGLALAFGIMLAVFSFSRLFPLSLALLLFVGIGSTGYFAVNNTLIQSNITDEVRGRVMSIYSMTFSLMPLGTLMIGAIVEQVGAPFAIGGAGAIVAVFVLIMGIFRSSLRRLQ